MKTEYDIPENEIGVRHKVGDALEHAPGLEDEGGECHSGQIHADPNWKR